MSRIEELTQKLKRAKSDHEDACNRCRETQDKVERAALEYCKEKFGVEQGTIVTDGVKLYQVNCVEVLHYNIEGKPRLHVFPQKKDGSWSAKSKSLWTQWKVATDEQKAELGKK